MQEHLAVEGASPEQVGRHLEEIAAHLDAGGASPVEEFGPPDVLARELASANHSAITRWVRLIALTIGLVVWGVAFSLVLRGNAPVLLEAEDIVSYVAFGVVVFTSFSAASARTRDWAFSVSDGGGRQVLTSIALSLLSLAVLVVVVELVVDDRTFGLSSVRSWIAGLALAALLTPFTYWAYRRTLAGPRFPDGSPLKASMFARRVRTVRSSD